MCIFVTAIVPRESVSPALEKVCEKFGFSIKEMHNKSLWELFADGFQFLPSGEWCNCSTALGKLSDENWQKAVDLDAEVKKLKEKGWRAARIQRWLAEKQRVGERREHATNSKLTAELDRWVGLIDETLSTKMVSRFGLIFHMYNGRVDDEKIAVKGLERVPLNALTTEKLAHLNQDVLYEFVNK